MSSTTIAPATTSAGRTTGVLTMTAGLLFVLVPLVVEFVSGDAFVLMGVAGLLVVLALRGLHRLQRGADGRAGAVGLRLVYGGLVVLAALILTGDPLDAVLSGAAQQWAEGVFAVLGAISILALLVGVVAFSVGMTTARVFPRAAIWVFLAGMALALLTEMFEQSLSGGVPTVADVLPVVGFMVAGAGLLVLGRSAMRLAD